MLDNLKLKLRYECESNVLIDDESCENFTVTNTLSKNRLTVTITATKTISQMYCYLYCPYEYNEDTKVFVNGYQSWSTSCEYSPCNKQYGLRSICKFGVGKALASPCGDYSFKGYSELEGDVHGYSYGYIRDGLNVKLIGSLSEREGYTILFFKMHKNKLLLEKELEGFTLHAGESLKVFDLAYFEGEYDEVFDSYFSLLNLPKKDFPSLKGYTSWYNYFGKITEDILIRDLNSLAQFKDSVNIFQIDDGYQLHVGDWLTLKENHFPRGMKYLADEIHSKGLLAGIWLAPTLAAHNSNLLSAHPDWFLRKPDNKLLLGASAWGGAYILNYEKSEVKDYIRNVFDTVLNDWDYDMVKLDFLYSECLMPRNNKTRGQIMCETMDFLRECVGDKLILGCGVPLFPSFGKVDCCRVGCDVDLVFKDRFYANMTNRELVNTKNSINNAVFRRHLDGRAFSNDPDVFILRDGVKFTDTQKFILSKINGLFGSVLFVSDNVGDYSESMKARLLEVFDKTPIKVIKAEYTDKKHRILSIDYTQNDQTLNFTFDIKNGIVLS